jgi:hypothetical protein
MGGRLLAPVVEELLGVVVPRLVCCLGSGDDVVHQVEGEVVRLLIVTAGRDLTRGSLDDHRTVERGQRAEHLHRHPVIDERLDTIDMGRREVVVIEDPAGDHPLPRADLIPDELRGGRLVGLTVFVEDELGGFPRLLRPIRNQVRPFGHGLGHGTPPWWYGDNFPRIEAAPNPDVSTFESLWRGLALDEI